MGPRVFFRGLPSDDELAQAANKSGILMWLQPVGGNLGEQPAE